MTRDELILAVCSVIHSGPPTPDCRSARLAIGVMEPLIRADERERSTPVFVSSAPVIRAMADLRAQVEALPDHEIGEAHHDVLVRRADVLALIDGAGR